MAIRLLAVDLDGTLLNSLGEISPANRGALEAAASRGVRVVIVTGRRLASARPLVAALHCPLTLIASNGAWIGSPAGEAYRRDFLPRETATQVLQASRPYRAFAVLIFDTPGHGQVLMQQGASPEGPLGWYRKNSPEVLAQVADLEAEMRTDPIQVMFGGAPDLLAPLEPLLLGSPAASKIHLTWTKYPARDIALLDVMNRGCTKGSALKFWAERCRIQPSEILAIGDNLNDLEMLEFAGRPVVMRNSAAGLGRDGWPMTLSNDEDGVAAAIWKNVLCDKE